MTEPVIIAQRISALFKELFPGDDLQEFHRFWDKTFQLMEDEHFFDLKAIAERTRILLDASTEFLQEVVEARASELSDPSFSQSLIKHLVRGNTLRPSPGYYGYKEADLENPENPLGFYRFLSPYPQPPDAFSIFAPCMTNMIQRIFDGARMCWLSSSLVYHKLVTKSKLEQLNTVADKMHHRFMMTVKSGMRDAAAQEVVQRIDQLKAFVPALPLMNSQIFYEEGIRFYRQDEPHCYVSSSTPGLIIPEEFYGEEFYYPGITRDYPPNLFSMKNYMRYDESSRLQEWDKHLQRVAQDIFDSTGKELKNPYRNRYFIDGIMAAARQKPVHYQYHSGSVAMELQASYGKYPDSKRQLYLEDVKTLFSHFYRLHCDHQLFLYESPQFRKDSTLITLTPGLGGFSILSHRGKGKIVNGWKLNQSVISTTLGFALNLFSVLVPLSSLAGVASSIGQTTSQEIAKHWIESRFENTLADFVESRVLDRYSSKKKQEQFVEKAISRWIGLDVSEIRSH